MSGAQEQITIVDESDTVIRPGYKRDVWRTGAAHRIARVFLFNSNGELLIQKRSPEHISLPNKWDQSAAGHVQYGESYREAATRELLEEVGIVAELTKRGVLCTDETDEADKIKKTL